MAADGQRYRCAEGTHPGGLDGHRMCHKEVLDGRTGCERRRRRAADRATPMARPPMSNTNEIAASTTKGGPPCGRRVPEVGTSGESFIQ